MQGLPNSEFASVTSVSVDCKVTRIGLFQIVWRMCSFDPIQKLAKTSEKTCRE